jgi:hypothetical protein
LKAKEIGEISSLFHEWRKSKVAKWLRIKLTHFWKTSLTWNVFNIFTNN